MRLSTLIFLLLLVLSLCTSASAQTIINCGDGFFDPGGANGNYPDDAFETYQICPTVNGEVASVSFPFLELEFCCDAVTVYNGIGTTDFIDSPTSPGNLYTSTAADGCLTVTFESDGSVTEAGFEATTRCDPPATCPAPQNVGATETTSTSLTFDWNGNEIGYDVWLVPAGDPLPAAPTFEDVLSPYTFSGLSEDTAYDFYVRADCDGNAGNDESLTVGPVTVMTLGPPPANDECANAIALPLEPLGDFCDFDTEYFDATGTASNPTAAVCSDPTVTDLWYTFVPATTSVLISIVDNDPSGEGGGRLFEVFSGDCNSLTSVGCSERPTNLTPGATYYLRVLGSFGFEQGNGYSICIQDQVAPPDNDDCADAVPLPVSAATTCGNPTAATTQGANQSLPANCGGEPDDDVWFSFTATGPNHLLYLTEVENVSGTFGRDLQYEVFSGACGTLTSVVCSRFSSFNDPPATLTGLTAGTDYLLRIYTARSPAQVNFNICLASPPANDECAGAFTVPVNSTVDCDQFLGASTLGSTVSGGTCGIATNNGDVWYTFTATAEKHLIRAFNLAEANGGTRADLYYELSDGGCDPANLNVLACGPLTSTFVVEAPDLTVGEEYHIRIWTRRPSTIVNFDLCVGTPPPNDECTGAFVAPVNPNLSNTLTIGGTSFGATRSFDIQSSETGCSRVANDDDVWYRFTAIAEEHRVSLLNLTAVSFAGFSDDTNAIIRLYPGGQSCASGDELDCGFPRSDTDEVLFSNLTVGEEYFISVQSQNGNNQITFDLSIKTEPLLLPVELTSFTGAATAKANVLQWVVASEENFSHYAVERSPNGFSNWSELGKVMGAAAGAVQRERDYSFRDESPLNEGFYRLRSIDLDGSDAVSKVVSINRVGGGNLSVYPNPARDNFRVDFPGAPAGLIARLYDGSGRLVRAQPLEADWSGYPAGLYYLAVRHGGEEYVERVVIR
ncbi:fibronectin type III domain-containing protein [Lewinella sp. 4G2]|uniref:fibronectin type III domain-containing protein n=1 Tax=Lewinella sp. 4G2 TaxID=1803372 RepID=UPI0007B4C66E|nr:fibronectin type III domain-containing protein [Lewinella sp. 4G2]OAV43164.1 hypothetical protein A3850_001035 [Lewinella sp. 4G2]